MLVLFDRPGYFTSALDLNELFTQLEFSVRAKKRLPCVHLVQYAAEGKVVCPVVGLVKH